MSVEFDGVTILTVLAALAALVLGQLRWLRVAQRVQYLPGEVSRIERLWFARRPLGLLFWVLAITAAIVGYLAPVVGSAALVWLIPAAPLLSALTPWRLPVWGVTKAMAWTSRVVRLLVVNIVLLIGGGYLSVVYLGEA